MGRCMGWNMGGDVMGGYKHTFKLCVSFDKRAKLNMRSTNVTWFFIQNVFLIRQVYIISWESVLSSIFSLSHKSASLAKGVTELSDILYSVGSLGQTTFFLKMFLFIKLYAGSVRKSLANFFGNNIISFALLL